jgi:hypothetical protein
MRKRSASFMIPVLALVVFVFGFAITINAQTCSQADVQAAVNAAASGGTVQVPSGTCTWSSDVTVTKAIHLQGAGIGSTVINGGVSYNPTTTEASKVFEMNGFTFQGTGAHFTPNAPGATTPITGLAIHDNAFNGSSVRALVLSGLEYGVFYNNTFSGNFISVSVIGVGWPGETYPSTFGSANYPYFEDNTFGNGTGEFVSEEGQGGRLVFRHNTITGYACSGCEVFDIHGEQGSGGWSVSTEIYHNSINVGASGTYRWVHHRGGQAVIFNNTVNRNIAFNFTEYQAWGGNGICNAYPIGYNSSENYCSPINGTSCLETQIHNSFYFNNLVGGSQQTPSYTEGSGGSCGSDPPWGDDQYIRLNREYWLPTYGPAGSLPATCTADGNTYYGATDTDVIYKCTAPNTWSVFYQPYTYPHPLRAGSWVAPPTNLTVVVQ